MTKNLLYLNLCQFIPKITFIHFMDPLDLAGQGVIAVKAGLLDDPALLSTAGFQVTPTDYAKFASELL